MSTRAQLKQYFQTGDKPTSAEFADLIDSLAHAGEDGLATQSFVTSTVNSAINSLVGGAPGALDTLDELAAALADDQNFATTITNALAGKQNTLVSGSSIRTINGQSLLGSGDIVISGNLVLEAANTLAQRNGASAQAFRIYNTFTDAANHERGFMRWLANVLEIGTEAAGTGSIRDLALLVAQGRAVYFNGTGRSRLSIRSDGNDPVIAADGTSAVHLFLTAGTNGFLYANGGQGVLLQQAGDVNNVVVVSPSNGNSAICDSAGVGMRRGLAFAGFGTTDFYLACPGRPNIDEAKMNFRITGAAARPAATVNLSGGGIFIEAGDGASASSGAANGGNLTLRGGRGYGTGVNGRIIMDRLPTSSAGLPTGALWNDAGTLKIA